MQIVEVPIDELRPDLANPRRISDDRLEALTRSLKQFGFVQPVLARAEDKTIIGGHQRLLAARRLGYKSVPVTFLDITQDQARVLNLGLNKISGDWDRELLARLLAELQPIDDIDLSLTGFAEDEIGKLLKGLELREKRERSESFDLEAALEAARAAPRAEQGDVWAMGEHRLLVGDSTDPVAVALLLSGSRPSMAFCDPPYNVALGDHGGQQPGKRRRRLENDALNPEDWDSFLRSWTRNLVDSVDGAIYICMSTREWPSLSRVLAEVGGHWSDSLIWDKQQFVIGTRDYQTRYEPIWYGWREGARHYWCGARNQSNVLSFQRPHLSEAHPTMKPVQLVQKLIENSSRPGEMVTDFFLGSGTTVNAAERTGRVCLGLEIDPGYASITIARWEAFTGERAVKLERTR